MLLALVFLLYTFFRSNLDYRDYLYLRYVSYPASKHTFKKVEIRSKATVVKETHSYFCFSDEDQAPSDDVMNNDDVITCDSTASDTDLGYSSTPTHEVMNFEFF